jgi:hypothetical protein
MAAEERISAKTLGALAMPDFCPRCFWIHRRAKNLPYQIFPGIFSSIDSYGKKVVHGWFDRHGVPPAWFAKLGEIRGYETPPHHSKFQALDDETKILLTGTPDGILIRGDGARVIVDYKTAKFTEFQDELFPMYDAQLNAYAQIGEQIWKQAVGALALIYTEPVTDDATAHNESNISEGGFQLPFSVKILVVERKPELVPSLLRRARTILDLQTAPAPPRGCKNCEYLDQLILVTRG